MRALRYLLIAPAAILAALAVQFPIHWAALLLFHQDGFLQFMEPETLERLGRAAILPGVVVAAGAVTAPGYRTRVAVSLAVLVVALLGGLVIWFEFSPVAPSALTDHPLVVIVKILLCVASAGAGVYGTWHYEH